MQNQMLYAVTTTALTVRVTAYNTTTVYITTYIYYRKGLIVSVDEWLRFHTTETVGVVFKHLRQEINQSLLSRLESVADDTSSAVMVSLVTRLLEIEVAHAT
jgi:hypothetical protein